jgi:hypothetical protein
MALPSAVPSSTEPFMPKFLLALAVVCVAFDSATAQLPAPAPAPTPSPAQPEAQFPAMKVEKFDPALSGDEFEDPAWEFSIRPPKGLLAVDPATMAKIREAMIPPEDKRRLPSGAVQKMQVHKFEDPRGATLLVQLFDPPLNVNSPSDLRSAILANFSGKQTKLEPSGKLLQFRARGNRVGFLCEFDITANAMLPSHQYVAAIRGGSRTALLFLTAPQSIFGEYTTAFQQAVTQVSLRDSSVESAEAPAFAATKFEGARNTLTILGNLALIIVVSLGIWRASRAS